MSPGKTIEPLWWSLFSAGGVVAAFLVPVHLFLFGLAIPLGWVSVSHARLLALVGHPVVKLYLFVLIALPLYHWAHRFRFVLEDLGRSEEHTSELQSQSNLVCRLLLEKKKHS